MSFWKLVLAGLAVKYYNFPLRIFWLIVALLFFGLYNILNLVSSSMKSVQPSTSSSSYGAAQILS
jgi:hypothetical protein